MEKLVAPVECGVQRLMTPQSRSAATHQQAEAVVQERRQFSKPEGVDAAGCQFDGERNPVQFAENLGNDRCVRVGQVECVQAFYCALYEKLDSRIRECLGRGKLARDGRNFQRH